ncbi:MAG: glycoside hydrolase family 78 protein [Acidobacteriota bacterium]|nr:glycoside hydrolase family 78 protein [Acidobacteriota bacterium]
MKKRNTLSCLLTLVTIFVTSQMLTPAQQSSSVSPVRHRVGKFIWSEGETHPYHFYLFARRNFQLESLPQAAKLHITASDRYLAFVNGNYLGRGPARSDPRLKNYDSYDVAKYLKQGKNTIAIRAYHYGTQNSPGEPKPRPGTAYSVGERAGLWAEIEMQDGTGKSQILGTDDSWRIYRARAWDRQTKLINILVGSTEIYDAAADPAQWMETGFDDAFWEKAFVIPQRSLEWVLLEKRAIPFMREKEIFPTSVVRVAEVMDMGNRGQKDIPEFLSGEIHLPLDKATAQSVPAILRDDNQSGVFESNFAEEKGFRAPVIIVDFGRQVFGFPRVKMKGDAGTIVDMNYSQQLMGDRLSGGLRYGDRYITRQGEQTWEVAEYKQFRYLQITPRSRYAPISIESVSLNEYGYPAEQKGRFESSDPFLNKLWQACVDTTYLQMEDNILCDAQRERAVWSTGDGSHGLHGIFMAYGDIPLTDHFFRSFLMSDIDNGMLRMAYPPKQEYFYNIPQFLLQWSTRVREQYLFTGRKTLLAELYSSVKRQTDWFEVHRDAMGLLRDLPYWNFWDWTPTDMRGANFTTNALYIKALDDAAWLADHLGQKNDSLRWKKIAEEVRVVSRRVFWNEQRGRYEDSHHNGKLTGVASEVGNAYALHYGIATEEQVPRIGKAFLDKGQELVPTSPLYAGYVFEGLIAAEFTDTALQIIRSRFAPMINSTDTPTIWEGWFPFTGQQQFADNEASFRIRNQIRPFGIRSMVHTGGVLTGFILTTQVLGVQPTAAGFSEFVIHPHPGDLTSMEGVVPSPKGDIKVDWRKEGGVFTIETETPAGTNAEVVLKRDISKNQVLRHNNRIVKTESTGKGKKETAQADSKYIRLRISAGRHTIELRD